MGGHHEHRDGAGRSRSGAWEGFESLHKALEGLASAKGVSQSRIGAVAKLAAHYAKFYKHVVHDIEMFVWKAEVEHRLAGLYAIDAIIRQAHAKNPKDAYVRRFLIRLADTFAAVKKVPEQMLPKVRHVIEEWQKRGIYTAAQIEEAGGQEFLLRDGNGTPRASQEKLASLLSIIKQKKEEHELPSEQRPPFDERDRRRLDEEGAAASRRGYDDRRGSEPAYERRGAGGIMGDAPGVPVGSRVRRAPSDRDSDRDDDMRDAKKARGSRWGPPRPGGNDRPAPIVTSLDRESEYGRDNGRPSYESPQGNSRPAPLLQSPHGGPPRHEWNRGGDRNAPGSRGSGSSWPPNESPQSANFGRLDRGPPSAGRNDANAYDQGGMQRSPFSRLNDRRSPHMQGTRSNRIPGTSGEICRNFLAGRCTYGDQCWHIHDPQNQQSDRPRSDVSEPKRKTVLCNNFPLGKCRFGNNCSFAHGEEELDKSARYQARGSAQGYDEQAGGRWQPSPSGPSALSDNAPLHQARSYGSPQAVYNEALGDRGTRGGDSSVSYANAAAPSPGGRRLPDQQLASTAPPQGYPGSYSSATSPYGASTGSAFVNQDPTYPDQGRTGVPPAASKVLADDDDVDTVEPEFTLQYDDDD